VFTNFSKEFQTPNFRDILLVENLLISCRRADMTKLIVADDIANTPNKPTTNYS
jgi:hypothetical protein